MKQVSLVVWRSMMTITSLLRWRTTPSKINRSESYTILPTECGYSSILLFNQREPGDRPGTTFIVHSLSSDPPFECTSLLSDAVLYPAQATWKPLALLFFSHVVFNSTECCEFCIHKLSMQSKCSFKIRMNARRLNLPLIASFERLVFATWSWGECNPLPPSLTPSLKKE